MIDGLNQFFSDLSNLLWGWPMIILLLGTHIYLTIILRFPQRHIFKAIRLSIKRDHEATGDLLPQPLPLPLEQVISLE